MSGQDHKQALPAGYRLRSHRVVRVLGAGGFGVTYLCEHAGLGVQVAVKEYLPSEIAVRDGAAVHPKSAGDRAGFEWGLSRFLDEARTLARFEHPNVVRVRDCFEANRTAYIVMDYEDGESLSRLLQRWRTLTEAQLKRVVLPVADGLRHVHAAGFLHRDVKPSNIFVRRSGESPLVLDFGSARQALGRRSRSMTAVASAGYSPPEQYESRGDQGAWTDIYALSALCYRAITGKVPVEAPRRTGELARSRADPQVRLATSGARGYSPGLLDAVDWGLRVIETERPQSVDEWLSRTEEPRPGPLRKSRATRPTNEVVTDIHPKPWGRTLEEFFETFGCCIGTELRWYQESWEVLMRAGRTSHNPDNSAADTLSKLQAICLLHMYLGIYQQDGSPAGDSMEPGCLLQMFEVLSISRLELLEVLGADGWFGLEDAQAVLREWDEEDDLVDRTLAECCSWREASELLTRERGEGLVDHIATSFLEVFGPDVVSDLIRTDNQLIYSEICEHYHGEFGLVTSILNSRRELEHVGYDYAVANRLAHSVLEGELSDFEGADDLENLDFQLRVYSYVEDGMTDWTANPCW